MALLSGSEPHREGDAREGRERGGAGTMCGEPANAGLRRARRGRGGPLAVAPARVWRGVKILPLSPGTGVAHAGGTTGLVSIRHQGELLGLWDPQNRDPRQKSPPETYF